MKIISQSRQSKILACSIFIFIFSIVINSVDAQTLHCYSGAKIEDNDKESFAIFQTDSFNLYSVHRKAQNYFLGIYDKDSLKKTAIIKVPLPSRDTTEYTLEGLFIRKDTFQIFYSFFDEKNLCAKLEMTTFSRRGEKICETKLIDKSAGKNERRAGKFGILNNEKSNEFVSFGYKTLKDTTYVNIDHFDYSGNKIRTQNFIFSEDFGRVIYTHIDDYCNLYYLVKSRSIFVKSKWSLRIYSPGVDSVRIIKLNEPADDKILLSDFFKTYIDNNGRLYLISSYTLSTFSKYAQGIYLIEVDCKTLSLMKEKVIPFKEHAENSTDESDISLSACIPMEIIPMSDDRLKIVFESRLKTTNSFYGIPVSNVFNMGNIVTIDMDSNNVVTEIHSIKKQQGATKESFNLTGFATLNHNNKSYFIYNELPDNLKRIPSKMNGISSGRYNETIVIYTVADSGKVIRKPLIDKLPYSDTDAIIPSSYLEQKNERQIFLLRKKGSDVYLTKIFATD